MEKNKEFKKLALVCNYWCTDNFRAAETIIRRLTLGIIRVVPNTCFLIPTWKA